MLDPVLNPGRFKPRGVAASRGEQRAASDGKTFRVRLRYKADVRKIGQRHSEELSRIINMPYPRAPRGPLDVRLIDFAIPAALAAIVVTIIAFGSFVGWLQGG